MTSCGDPWPKDRGSKQAQGNAERKACYLNDDWGEEPDLQNKISTLSQLLQAFETNAMALDDNSLPG